MREWRLWPLAKMRNERGLTRRLFRCAPSGFELKMTHARGQKAVDNCDGWNLPSMRSPDSCLASCRRWESMAPVSHVSCSFFAALTNSRRLPIQRTPDVRDGFLAEAVGRIEHRQCREDGVPHDDDDLAQRPDRVCLLEAPQPPQTPGDPEVQRDELERREFEIDGHLHHLEFVHPSSGQEAV